MHDLAKELWLPGLSATIALTAAVVPYWWPSQSWALRLLPGIAAAGAVLALYRIQLMLHRNTLAKQKRVFWDFLDRLVDCAVVVDARGTILHLSTGAARYDLNPAAIVGKSWADVVPAANHDFLRSLVRSELAEGHSVSGPIARELLLPRGDRRFFDVAVYRIDTGGEPHLLFAFNDATERRVVSEGMAHMDRMAAVAHLSAGVIHNFNNILAGIMLNASLLADAEGEERQSLADRVIASAERGASLCRNLTTFARREVPSLGPVPLRPLLANLLLLFETEANRYGVQVNCQIDPSLAVLGDGAHIQQILLNLLFNAREAVGSNGRIRLTASRSADTVRIAVWNNGPQIPPELLPLIFLPFFSTKAETIQGSGMGLAVCLSLARGLGGTIEVESPPGAETSFSLVLPAADGH